MYCPKCGSHATKVKDIAHSHQTPTRSRKYLSDWGEQIKHSGLAYTARKLECANCGTRYRSLEVLYTDPSRKWRRSK